MMNYFTRQKLTIRLLLSILLQLMLLYPAYAQGQVRLKGKVHNLEGQPLEGVSVLIKGSNTGGVFSDAQGAFELELATGKTTLVFSYVGYEELELAVEGREFVEVTMQPVDASMDDVVVVAYGKQKKQEVVGSVTSINPSELKVPSSNLTTALAGRLAGVIAYQRSGEPGQDNASFFIRGVTTFGYKVDPLILIDGVELTSTDLARLQPDDIASFSIMKDATATALYGARGANGVILVTTKEGKEGKAKVSVRVENSISSPTRNVDLADPITYMKLHNEAVLTRDPLGQLPYSQEKIENTINGTNPYVYPATDWRSMLFKEHANNQRANLNVSGGGAVARYYFAGTFTQDHGVLNVDKRNNFNNNINLKNYLLRSNVNVNVTKTTEVGVRLYGSFDDYTGPIDGGAAMYQKVMQANPVLFPAFYPVTDEYTYVRHILFGNTSYGNNYINPYAEMVKGYRDYSRSLMMAQFELKQDLNFLTKGLSFRAMGNTNRRSYFDVTRSYNPFFYEPVNYDRRENTYKLRVLNEASATEYLNYSLGDKVISSTFYLESALNYNRTFQKHGFSGLLVYIMRQNLDADADDLQQSLPSRNTGVSGRATYAFDRRLFAEFNFGYNGSERFSTNHRFGFFPSAGLAWQLSNEKFWQPLQNTINLFKIRATYGWVGNDAIGSPADRFFYLSNVDMDNAGRGARFGTDYEYIRDGVAIKRYDNKNITWEVSEKKNLGIELGLFNKINIQADIFSEYRKNILMTRASIPTTMGLEANIMANVGEARGKGIDFSVDYKQDLGTSAWLIARGNFTYATNKYAVYEEPKYENEPYLSRVGYSITQQWGYVAEHLFIDDYEVAHAPLQTFGLYGAGDIRYKDINGDGQITTLDRVPIGKPTVPEIVYGFGISGGIKNFDLSFFFQGAAKESFWIDANATAPFVQNRQLLKAYADSYWSESNQQLYALWPRLSTVQSENNTLTSTWFMRDGSFLRLKSVEAGYTFKKPSIGKARLDGFRVYLSGTNLLTWSQFKLWDVEMAGNGMGYPLQKVMNLGFLVNF